jgi:MinD-like ATPase involved in chromosome partitioning or flagellar assembly
MSRTISSLLDSVAENDLLDIPQVIKPIVSYKPHLVINKAASLLQANQVVNTISDLAQRYLSIKVDCPGYINHHSEIERNLRNNIPLVAQSPNGELAQEISHIAANSGLI